MSAYIVSKDQIEVLVAAGAHVAGLKDTEHATHVGQDLLDECVRSVSYRYPNDDLGELPGCYVEETAAPGIAPVTFAEWLTPYTFRGERVPDREEVAETISCYEYQSCEHPEWAESWAHSYCERLRRVLHELPERVVPVVEAPAHDYGSLARDETIKRIRAALKRRSGKTWSVTGGRGTGWGWIHITAPPKRRVGWGYMTDEDQRELGELLGKSRVHCQGESIPSSSDYYREYIDRAEGRTPTTHGTPYWD